MVAAQQELIAVFRNDTLQVKQAVWRGGLAAFWPAFTAFVGGSTAAFSPAFTAFAGGSTAFVLRLT